MLFGNLAERKSQQAMNERHFRVLGSHRTHRDVRTIGIIGSIRGLRDLGRIVSSSHSCGGIRVVLRRLRGIRSSRVTSIRGCASKNVLRKRYSIKNNSLPQNHTVIQSSWIKTELSQGSLSSVGIGQILQVLGKCSLARKVICDASSTSSLINILLIQLDLLLELKHLLSTLPLQLLLHEQHVVLVILQ